MPRNALPKLPQLLERKIYKTGQTRGADDDAIYQNRVARNSTVLIPYAFWEQCRVPSVMEATYENSFIVLLSPEEYFGSQNINEELNSRGLKIGVNTLVFYETREQWNENNPRTLKWIPAKRRAAPLGGQYVARVPATTAMENGERIVRGFDATAMKGAGIRVYEYASSTTNTQCRLQLEVLYWMCVDAVDVVAGNGMTADSALKRKESIRAQCEEQGLLDLQKLRHARIIGSSHHTICPLCLDELSGHGFFARMEQAEGRVVPDLTVTQLNLFHIEELRTGVLNHKPYNLGWGHHHCNVVVKDAGIAETLRWMQDVLNRNIRDGHFTPANNGN